MSKNKVIYALVKTITKYLMYMIICVKLLDGTGSAIMLVILMASFFVELSHYD